MNSKDNRILARIQARDLTTAEVNRLRAGSHKTLVITVNPVTPHLDGDGASLD